MAPYWLLVIFVSTNSSISVEKVPMPSLAACERAAESLPGVWNLTLPNAHHLCIPGE